MPAEKKKDGKNDGQAEPLKGVYMFPNGDKYEGECTKTTDNILDRNGYGSHYTKEGMCYHGLWVNDKMNGRGRLENPSGAVFEGEFVNNRFHGSGRYTWPNGSFYEGNFVENRMEGDGEFTDTDGQVWTGMFRYKAAPGLRFKLNL